MKIFKPIGSKERFLEMFQGVNKTSLNEVAVNVMQTGTQLIEKAFEELKNKQASVKQTNTQTVGDENYVEIVTNDNEGNEITFTFKVNSTESDLDGVYDVNNGVLSKFKIKSRTLNVEMPENMKAVQEFNGNYGSEIIDVVTEFSNFETDTISVDNENEDEVYAEAVKLIDKVPYKKGSEEIQTHKAYADQKPTNPEVRVDSDELQTFVKEMQDFVDIVDAEEDPFALPPDYTMADLPKDPDVADPYDMIDTDYNGAEASPEEQAVFSQAYDNLVAAGNQAPTTIEIENEVNRLQGNVKPIEKTRAIPKGAEPFYESTDQDKYEDVVFMQGEEADEALEILRNQGEEAALQYLMQWHDSGNHMGNAELGHGSSDQTFEKDGYIMSWSFPLNYIGLQYESSGLDEETKKNDYPDQIGKRFKPKDQMPKKKKKPQYTVKLGEESEIPKEYWGNPEDELKENDEPQDDGMSLEPRGDEIEQVSQEKEEMGDMLAGGLADDKVAAEFDPEQIAMGIKVEMEHTDDPKIALEIAMDHLTEIPDYYTHLDKMEKDVETNGAGSTDPINPSGCLPPEMYGDEESVGDRDNELSDELLGYKPHNVQDYATEEMDYAAREKDYWNKEYHKQDQEKEHPLADILDTDGTEDDLSKQNTGEKGVNRALEGQNLAEEDGFDEYAGEIGDRYQDGEGNQFTVRDKVNGGVTLQGQGGEKEIATRDIGFLKKLSEEKVVKKEIITEEQIKTARQALNKRGLNEGMTKKEAVRILIKHNIR